jgi:hypothetical protein
LHNSCLPFLSGRQEFFSLFDGRQYIGNGEGTHKSRYIAVIAIRKEPQQSGLQRLAVTIDVAAFFDKKYQQEVILMISLDVVR